MARAPLFTWLKNKFYTKTEIDSKMNGKAPNTVVSSTSNGLMIATDKEKLDTVEVGANKTVVDGSMSATSSNPVQNKTVNAELDSLNSAKANINHTHKNLATSNLGANTNFNDLKTEGVYLISWDNVQSATNAPSTQGGRLEVKSIYKGVRQIFYSYGSSQVNHVIFHRGYYPNSQTWFDWKKIEDSSI